MRRSPAVPAPALVLGGHVVGHVVDDEEEDEESALERGAERGRRVFETCFLGGAAKEYSLFVVWIVFIPVSLLLLRCCCRRRCRCQRRTKFYRKYVKILDKNWERKGRLNGRFFPTLPGRPCIDIYTRLVSSFGTILQ